MKFNIIEFSDVTVEIGNQYPQIQDMTKDYDFDALDSVHQLEKYYNSLPDFHPNLDSFVLHKQSKITDFLSNGVVNNGFLISKKVVDILSNFNIPEHKFYPAKILHNGKLIEEYYWFQTAKNVKQFVDYKKSSFFILQNFSKNAGAIDIESEEDYVQKNMSIFMNDSSLCIWASKIVFNDSFPSTLDWFSLSKFNSNTFVSKEICQSLIGNNVTGIIIKSTDILAF